MHVNSLVAYFEGQTENFSKREKAVLDVIHRLKSATDRDVMVSLGFNDPNAVRPRITELIKEGVLQEVGSSEDVITGKTVRMVALMPDSARAQRQFQFAELPMIDATLRLDKGDPSLHEKFYENR